MRVLYLLAILAVLPGIVEYAQAQTINVNQTTPCFLNYTSGVNIWEECGMDEDYLQGALIGWEWISGGYFSLVIVSLFVMMTYIKYHKVVYPIMIGVLFMPVSFFLFPDVFLTFALIMSGVAVAILLWYIFAKQTKEY